MVIVRAPVRVSFGGGGTDIATYYAAHGGFVVSAAITRYCSVMAHRPADGGVRITSADYDITEGWQRGEIPKVQEPLSLPKAAIARFAGHGPRSTGIDLFLASEVPPGTGLGSSSAMAAALVRAMSAYTGLAMDAGTVADIACSLEIDYLGMPIGKQDQYAAAFGGLNMIEFSTRGVVVTPLGLPLDVMSALADRLFLFATGTRRNSASILSKQRKASASDPAVVQSLHRIKALAYEMCETLGREDLDGFGVLLDRGWREKRALSKSISSGEIDAWYLAAREAGALGGKITGAGGGGFMLLYVPPERQDAVRAVMSERGLSELTFDFDLHGAQVLSNAPQRLSLRNWDGDDAATPSGSPLWLRGLLRASDAARHGHRDPVDIRREAIDDARSH